MFIADGTYGVRRYSRRNLATCFRISQSFHTFYLILSDPNDVLLVEYEIYPFSLHFDLRINHSSSYWNSTSRRLKRKTDRPMPMLASGTKMPTPPNPGRYQSHRILSILRHSAAKRGMAGDVDAFCHQYSTPRPADRTQIALTEQIVIARHLTTLQFQHSEGFRRHGNPRAIPTRRCEGEQLHQQIIPMPLSLSVQPQSRGESQSSLFWTGNGK